MARILIRAGKDPFRIVSAEHTLASNLIGNNSGNLLFSTAAYKLLSTPGTDVVANGLGANPNDADRINEEYDCFVIPLANAYRPSFEPHLRRFTSLVERLKIPVVVLSSGAQSATSSGFESLRGIDDLVKRFLRAVLDRSAAVGVRGEFTERYLNQLGFRDAQVIGCPSMFMFGDRISVSKGTRRLDRKSKLSVNASADVKEMGDVIQAHHQRYPNLTYAAQGKVDLELLLWGDRPDAASKASRFPVHTSHPLYAENKIRFFLDPWPWLRYLSERDFSFGSRIHGNIAAILAGTPACVLAHDSRTLELARYFEIPHAMLREAGPDLDARKLYEEADFTSLHQNHASRFSTFITFVEKNGLDHIFAYPDAERAFDESMDRTPFPPPVESAFAASTEQLVARMHWLRKHHQESLTAVNKRLARLEARLPDPA